MMCYFGNDGKKQPPPKKDCGCFLLLMKTMDEAHALKSITEGKRKIPSVFQHTNALTIYKESNDISLSVRRQGNR